MELCILGLFAAGLLVCVGLGRSILYALVLGYLLFFGYGLWRGHSPKALWRASCRGVASVRNILLLFLLIGCMTALWRSAGTIPAIIAWTAGSLRPALFLPLCFLLNCLMSVLTGTSFGTAATMGVICMSIANSLGIAPALSGGAILAGTFFGDRCSPVSSSALLVSELTGTGIFDNIRGMLRTAWVPLLLSCGFYLALGLGSGASGGGPDLQALFGAEFCLTPIVLLPAAAILLLSLLRVPVKRLMLVSLLCAAVLSLTVQQVSPALLLQSLLFGYHAPTAQLAALLDGGGIVSMVRVSLIVSLSSSFSGLLDETGLLLSLKAHMERLAARTTPFAGVLLTALAASLVSCNQTLAILLTHQLCRDLMPDRRQLALALENSAVLVAPLIPWSIAGSVPLTTVGAPTASIWFACYLYLVPLWALLQAHRAKQRREQPAA